jgi:hypothetical protein
VMGQSLKMNLTQLRQLPYGSVLKKNSNIYVIVQGLDGCTLTQATTGLWIFLSQITASEAVGYELLFNPNSQP